MIRILMFVLSFVIAFSAQAQKPKEKTLLWKIEGKNINTPSFLFGTYHMLCPEDFNIPDTVKTLIANSKQIIFEIDLDDPQLTSKMMKGIKMKDGKKLKDFFSESDYDSIAGLFKKITGMSINAFETYKPFLLVSMLYPKMMNCATIAFEKELEKIAKNNHLEVKGLETIEDQLNVFDKIPYNVQAEAVKKTLFGLEEGKEQMKKMVEMYKSKDIRAMQTSINSDTDLGNYDKVLLSNRNKNWIAVIEKEITSLPTFIAVGAGHLAGKKGVIYLLRKNGYQVTPVMY